GRGSPVSALELVIGRSHNRVRENIAVSDIANDLLCHQEKRSHARRRRDSPIIAHGRERAVGTKIASSGGGRGEMRWPTGVAGQDDRSARRTLLAKGAHPRVHVGACDVGCGAAGNDNGGRRRRLGYTQQVIVTSASDTCTGIVLGLCRARGVVISIKRIVSD